MTAKEFILNRDNEKGQHWSENTEELEIAFEEYTRIRIKEYIENAIEIKNLMDKMNKMVDSELATALLNGD